MIFFECVQKRGPSFSSLLVISTSYSSSFLFSFLSLFSFLRTGEFFFQKEVGRAVIESKRSREWVRRCFNTGVLGFFEHL